MLLARLRTLSSIDRPLSDRIGALLIPRAFLSSIVAGFLFMAFLGYVSTKRPIFQNYLRMHQVISGEGLFNPTALQLRRLVAQLPRNKVLVIVGGSSRLFGVGQSPSGLWTNRLQRLLGPDFRVINLALRAGGPDQFGSYAAESMIKEGRKVIYVADTDPAYRLSVFGRQPEHHYLFYDAEVRGLLLKSSSRDEFVRGVEESSAAKLELQELYLRARLNRIVYFDDLWTYAGYWYFFIGAWSPYAHPLPMRARVNISAPDQTVSPAILSPQIVEQILVPYRRYTKKFEQAATDANEEALKTQPQGLRTHSIWFPIYISPHYRANFTSEENLGYAENFEILDVALRRTGYTSLIVGVDWSIDDYVDIVHLSEKGGRKLAEAVAPLVVEKARTLGYVK